MTQPPCGALQVFMCLLYSRTSTVQISPKGSAAPGSARQLQQHKLDRLSALAFPAQRRASFRQRQTNTSKFTHHTSSAPTLPPSVPWLDNSRLQAAGRFRAPSSRQVVTNTCAHARTRTRPALPCHQCPTTACPSLRHHAAPWRTCQAAPVQTPSVNAQT